MRPFPPGSFALHPPRLGAPAKAMPRPRMRRDQRSQGMAQTSAGRKKKPSLHCSRALPPRPPRLRQFTRAFLPVPGSRSFPRGFQTERRPGKSCRRPRDSAARKANENASPVASWEPVPTIQGGRKAPVRNPASGTLRGAIEYSRADYPGRRIYDHRPQFQNSQRLPG
jgi:hypothetical protein